MVIVKDVNSTSNWAVWHRGSGGNTDVSELNLNSTSAALMNPAYNSSYFTATTFNPTAVFDTTPVNMNATGHTYVAYLFAHDPDTTNGIIQEGSFNGGGSPNVNLGWEPQYVMIRRANVTDNWWILDTSRGWTGIPGNMQALQAQSSSAESAASAFYLTPTGFAFNNLNEPGNTFIYLAIRRPNKPPTSGTKVFGMVARTGTNSATSLT